MGYKDVLRSLNRQYKIVHHHHTYLFTIKEASDPIKYVIFLRRSDMASDSISFLFDKSYGLGQSEIRQLVHKKLNYYL